MHKIEIPQKYIDRCLKRRGRRHLYDRIDAKGSALLVIDMQNSFVVPDLSPLEVPGLDAIIPNINRLAAAARAAGALVVWTTQSFTPEWSSWYGHYATPEVRDLIIAQTAPGAYGAELADGLDVQPRDLRSMKTRSSALTPGASDLEAMLRERDIDTVVIAGTLTNVCCEATARDAMQLNFKTVFVADANGARSDEEHNATLVNMIQFFADVRFTDEVVGLFGADAGITAAAG